MHNINHRVRYKLIKYKSIIYKYPQYFLIFKITSNFIFRIQFNVMFANKSLASISSRIFRRKKKTLFNNTNYHNTFSVILLLDKKHTHNIAFNLDTYQKWRLTLLIPNNNLYFCLIWGQDFLNEYSRRESLKSRHSDKLLEIS